MLESNFVLNFKEVIFHQQIKSKCSYPNPSGKIRLALHVQINGLNICALLEILWRTVFHQILLDRFSNSLSKQYFSKFDVYKNLLGLLLKHRSDSVLLGQSLRFCMASKLPGDIHATGQGPHFECQGQRKWPKDCFLTFHAYIQAAVVRVKMPKLLISSELKDRNRQ